MLNILTKIFGNRNDRVLKKMLPVVDQVNAFSEPVAKLTDEELSAKTVEFRQRLEHGATLDELLPEAFAVVREASARVLGMRHFDMQLIGGAILH